MYQIQCRLGLRPRPRCVSLQRSPDSLYVDLNGRRLASKRKGRGGEGIVVGIGGERAGEGEERS